MIPYVLFHSFDVFTIILQCRKYRKTIEGVGVSKPLPGTVIDLVCEKNIYLRGLSTVLVFFPTTKFIVWFCFRQSGVKHKKQHNNHYVSLLGKTSATVQYIHFHPCPNERRAYPGPHNAHSSKHFLLSTLSFFLILSPSLPLSVSLTLFLLLLPPLSMFSLSHSQVTISQALNIKPSLSLHIHHPLRSRVLRYPIDMMLLLP